MKALARRYLFGLYSLVLAIVPNLPSQRLRKLILRGVFRMKMDPKAVMYLGCHLRAPHKIFIGAGTSVGDHVTLDGRAGLTIGRNVNISTEAMFWTAQHDYNDPDFTTVYRPIVVSDYAWIGPRVIVLPGSHIAEGVVVAGGSLLRGKTEPYGLYAGTPAKRIGERSRDVRYVPSANYTPFI